MCETPAIVERHSGSFLFIDVKSPCKGSDRHVVAINETFQSHKSSNSQSILYRG